MPTQLAVEFRAGIDDLQAALRAVSPALADSPWRPGGWTRKEIVGHLLDSASNNRHRFVWAAIDGKYAGRQYEQKEWVAAHGYTGQSWETLVRWWQAEHEILMAVVDRIPHERLQATCAVGDEPPVTLQFLIENYLTHQRGHFQQLVLT
jgi:hypothetical protein